MDVRLITIDRNYVSLKMRFCSLYDTSVHLYYTFDIFCSISQKYLLDNESMKLWVKKREKIICKT